MSAAASKKKSPTLESLENCSDVEQMSSEEGKAILYLLNEKFDKLLEKLDERDQKIEKMESRIHKLEAENEEIRDT